MWSNKFNQKGELTSVLALLTLSIMTAGLFIGARGTTDSSLSSFFSRAASYVGLNNDPGTVCTDVGQMWASEVVEANQGLLENGSSIETQDSNRLNPALALGPADGPSQGTFFSLGRQLQGKKAMLTVAFPQAAINHDGPDIAVYEITWNRPAYYIEEATVEGSADGQSWQFLGVANNKDNESGISYFDIAASGLSEVRYVRLVDKSDYNPPLPQRSVRDGYDTDAVSAIERVCSPQLLPTQPQVDQPIPTSANPPSEVTQTLITPLPSSITIITSLPGISSTPIVGRPSPTRNRTSPSLTLIPSTLRQPSLTPVPLRQPSVTTLPLTTPRMTTLPSPTQPNPTDEPKPSTPETVPSEQPSPPEEVVFPSTTPTSPPPPPVCQVECSELELGVTSPIGLVCKEVVPSCFIGRVVGALGFDGDRFCKVELRWVNPNCPESQDCSCRDIPPTEVPLTPPVEPTPLPTLTPEVTQVFTKPLPSPTLPLQVSPLPTEPIRIPTDSEGQLPTPVSPRLPTPTRSPNANLNTCVSADVNRDGIVNGTDYAKVMLLIGRTGTFAEDVNGDGRVDSTDSSAVLACLGSSVE